MAEIEAQTPKRQRPDGGEEGEGGEEEGEVDNGGLRPSLPVGKVKRIVKLDREIKKVNSEALFLISLSTDLFLAGLAARARDAALGQKRRTIKLDHLRSAARSHQPTADFLPDCLPVPSSPQVAVRAKTAASEKPLPPGARRIDDFFRKPPDAPQ